MSADLEATLNELGPDCRAVVDRLRAGRTVEPAFDLAAVDGDACGKTRYWIAWRPVWCVAASILVLLGVGLFLRAREESVPALPVTVYTVAYAPTEEALGIILASQRADGSWDNDFITRQNAAALRNVSDEKTQIAYRRAVRYLKSKGLAPLTDAELKSRGEFAARSLHADV